MASQFSITNTGTFDVLAGNTVSGKPFFASPIPLGIVTSNLVLHLDAGNTSSYPGSGTTWSDLSGNNTNGTLRNSPTFNSDGGGNIVFNGTNHYVETFSSLVDVTTNWTVNVWYKTTGSSGIGSLLVRGNFDETYQWRCELDASTGKVRFAMRNLAFPSDQSVLGTTSTNNTGWHMATYTNNSNLVTVYLDAVSENSATITNLTNSNIGSNAVIGRLGDSVGPYYFNGNVAIVQVYNRALSLSEIQQNFAARKSRYGL